MTPAHSPRHSASDVELGIPRPSVEARAVLRANKKLRWMRNRKIAKATFVAGLLAVVFTVGLGIYRLRRSDNIPRSRKKTRAAGGTGHLEKAVEDVNSNNESNVLKKFDLSERFQFTYKNLDYEDDPVTQELNFYKLRSNDCLHFRRGKEVTRMNTLWNFLEDDMPAFGLPPHSCDPHKNKRYVNDDRQDAQSNGRRIICINAKCNRNAVTESVYWVMMNCAPLPDKTVDANPSAMTNEPCLGFDNDLEEEFWLVWVQRESNPPKIKTEFEKEWYDAKLVRIENKSGKFQNKPTYVVELFHDARPKLMDFKRIVE